MPSPERPKGDGIVREQSPEEMFVKLRDWLKDSLGTELKHEQVVEALREVFPDLQEIAAEQDPMNIDSAKVRNMISRLESKGMNGHNSKLILLLYQLEWGLPSGGYTEGLPENDRKKIQDLGGTESAHNEIKRFTSDLEILLSGAF